MSRVPLAAVVLAAGASRRMGAPKAGLRLGGATLLARVVDAVSACAPVVVVAGADQAAVRAALPAGSPAQIVVNPAPEQGQLSSLQTGLRHLAATTTASGAVVALVDQPLVARATVDRLVAAARGGRHVVVVPVHDGRRGHPIVLLREVWDDILATPVQRSARDVVARDPDRVREVAVADPGVLIDVDTPDDLAALRRRVPPASVRPVPRR